MYSYIPDFKYKIDSFKNIKHLYRWQIWTVAVRIIKKYPFIGIGNGNFIKYYDKFKNPDWREGKGHPHNDFLSIYLTSGLIGFLGYMCIWIILLIKVLDFLKKNKANKYSYNIMIGLTSGVIAFLFAGLGQNYFTDSENSMLLWFFIGLILIIYYNKEDLNYFPQSIIEILKKKRNIKI